MLTERAMLERFERYKRQADGSWLVSCPCLRHEHGDRRPSLHVTLKPDDRWLLDCQAGCDTEIVMASTRPPIEWADLFAERTNGRREIAVYPYVDEDGLPLFEVVRSWPKSFYQRRPNGEKPPVGQKPMAGVRRVIYRLPKVIGATKAGRVVWIAAGEKDVHALERAGVVATTNPGGEGKWKRQYNEVFRGAVVVVVADRDQAGYDHARHVATQLRGVCGQVRIVEPATGKDAFDHFAAGHGLDEFAAVDGEVELAAIPDYPVGALPVAARSLIDSTNLPVGLVAGAALAALATAVGPKPVLRVMGRWTERANVWIALLAVRGAGKSPAMRLAFGPLHDRDALVEDDDEPLLTTDSTIEAVARILHNADGAATVYLDELSILLRGMGEYTGGGARGRWLALWSGEPWRYARVGGGGGLKLAVDIRIAAPTVVIVGGLQPALHELLGGDEDGLRPRWLPHYAVSSDEPLKRGPASRPWSDLLLRLLEDRGKSRTWELSGEAFEVFEAQRRRWAEQAADESETLAAALAKAPGHLARITLVLAEADAHGRGGPVLPSVVNRAARIVNYTLDSWRALPENGGLALTHRDAVLDQGVARLLAWLEGRPGRSADRRNLSRCRVAGARTPADLDALLARFEATFPGTLTYEDPPRGGPKKQIVRAPVRAVVTTGDNDTRTDGNPQAKAESGAVTTGDNDRGDNAGDNECGQEGLA